MNKKNKGQSLIEVLIALALFVVAVSVIFIVVGSQTTGIASLQKSYRAVSLAEEGLEATRIIRDNSWDLIAAGTYGLSFSSNSWTLQQTPDITDGFARTVTITDSAADERKIVSTVSWTDQNSKQHTVSLNSLLTNWRNAGQSLLRGDWTNPQSLGSIDLGPGNTGTSLFVRAKMVFMTAVASSAGKPDFYIIDATDGTAPVFKGSLNTGTGLNKVVVSGIYAYAANNSDSSQLQIIDISNPTSPALISSLDLDSEKALSVAISGNYVYIGTKSGDGKEFFVIDAADPSNPALAGSFEIGADVNDMFIYKNRVYLATSEDTREFIVIDAANPASPTQISAVDVLGSSENGTSIYVNRQDDKAYITRTVGGNHADHPELGIIYAANPPVPEFLGSLNFTSNVNSVVAADTLAFLATNNPNLEFQIYDVSDPSSIVFYSGLNFPQEATDIALENNIIYVSVRSNDALRIITSL